MIIGNVLLAVGLGVSALAAIALIVAGLAGAGQCARTRVLGEIVHWIAALALCGMIGAVIMQALDLWIT